MPADARSTSNRVAWCDEAPFERRLIEVGRPTHLAAPPLTAGKQPDGEDLKAPPQRDLRKRRKASRVTPANRPNQ